MLDQDSTHRFIQKAQRFGLRLLIVLVMIAVAAPTTPARASTDVCGTIATSTWNLAGSPYIVTCLVTVPVGAKLTIESGVRVLFNDNTSLRIDGELEADNVTFSSNNPSPTNGKWGHIIFTATSVDATFDGQGNYLSGSKIESSLFAFGGGGGIGIDGIIDVTGASPYLRNNTILYSAKRGIYAVGRSNTKPIVLQENTIQQNSGGGIYVTNGKVLGNIISSNGGSSGAGIYATNSIVSNNEVSQNTAGGQGGGIYSNGSTLTGNTVSGNSAKSNGAGIAATGGSVQSNTVTGNTLSPDNWEFVCGGGIYASGGTVSGNTVSGNKIQGGFFNPTTGGAGICALLSTVSQNSVSNNNASASTETALGGGIYSTGGSLSSNTVSGNSVTGNLNGRGGGIYAEGGTISNNTISGNTASGATVSQGGGIYGQQNTLSGNTITLNSAQQGGAIYSNKGTVTSNTILTNTTTITGTVYSFEGTANSNIVRNNVAVAGGGLFGTKATLNGNTVEYNQANKGAGIYALDSTVLGNTLKENAAQADGGGLWAKGGAITYNQIKLNSTPSYGHGSGAYLESVTNFSYNTVISNTASGGTVGGVTVGSASTLQYNNLYANSPYNIEVFGGQDVAGTLNYWGPASCQSIPGLIYDGNDLPGLGKVSYAPSLYSPLPFDQMATPLSLNMAGDDTAVNLDWAALPSLPDVGCRPSGYAGPDIGYKVFYGPNACPPFAGSNLPQGSSPIDVGEATSFQLTNLGSSAVYFTVAAYDYLGRLSGYSNVVVKPSSWKNVYLPLVRR